MSRIVEAGAKGARYAFATPDSTWEEIFRAALLAASEVEPDEEVVEAAAREIWADFLGRYAGGPLEPSDNTVAAIQVRATARAAISAFLKAAGGE